MWGFYSEEHALRVLFEEIIERKKLVQPSNQTSGLSAQDRLFYLTQLLTKQQMNIRILCSLVSMTVIKRLKMQHYRTICAAVMSTEHVISAGSEGPRQLYILCVCASLMVLRYRTITLPICHFHSHSHTFLINSHRHWGCSSVHVLWHVINSMIIKISM